MKPSDYVEWCIGWYGRRPFWVRVLLFPLMLVLGLVQFIWTMAFVILFLLLVTPILTIKHWLSERRFWNRLRARNQVAQWNDVERSLRERKGVLITEVHFKGLGYCWWIDRPRSEVDPDRVVPSWTDFEARSFDAFGSDAEFNALKLWVIQRLTAYESMAKAVVVTWPQIEGLPDDLKRDSILAVDWLCKGNMSERLR